MSRNDRERWNASWRERLEPGPPSRLLVEQRHLLSGGTALDIACGRGQNTLWLAGHGYRAVGVDISDVALRAAQRAYSQRGLQRRTLFVQADLDRWRAGHCSLDLITVFNFLDRGLFSNIRAALRPGGLLFYETRHVGLLERMPDATEAYLLRPNELQDLFSDWEQLYYGEGPESARLIARKIR